MYIDCTCMPLVIIILFTLFPIRLTVNISSRQRPMSNLLRKPGLDLKSTHFQYLFTFQPIRLPYVQSSMAKVETPSPVSIIWNFTTGICQPHEASCHIGYIGPLGLNLDRLARFGLPRSSINTWVDSSWVSEICKL